MTRLLDARNEGLLGQLVASADVSVLSHRGAGEPALRRPDQVSGQ